MSEITKNTAPNIPGIRQIEFVYPEEVSKEDFNLSNYSASVELKTGFAWKNIYFVDGSAGADIDAEKETPAGTRYDNSVKLVVPQGRSEVSIQLQKFKGKRVLLRITSFNGTRWLIGRVDNPARNTASLQIAGTNNYQLGFSCSQSHPCFYLTAVDSVQPS